MQLGDDHALRTVDHEGSIVRHRRNFAQEDVLLVRDVAILEHERGVQRLRIGLALVQRLLVRELRLAQLILHEVQHIAAIIARNRENLVENRLQTMFLALRGGDVLLQEVIVGLRLDFNQIRRIVRILQFAEYLALSFHWLTFQSCTDDSKTNGNENRQISPRMKCGKRPLC